MKKNWTQIITLCLCGILLAVTVVQGKQLSEFQQRMNNQMDSLRDSVEYEIQNISNNLEHELEKANQVVAEYTLEPAGIDKETHSLLATASVTLKQWYEDTEVTLLARIGNEEVSVLMTSDGNGAYSCSLSLPLEGNHEVFLDILVTGGGLTKKETLHAWGDVSRLLPLSDSGGGWSEPTYKDGIMSSNFHITLTGINGKPDPVQKPQFLTYKNGELVQTQNAIEDPYSDLPEGICYTVNTEDYKWSVPCDMGDVIDIRFRCEDKYGLGYEFLFQSWVAEKETAENQVGAGVQYGSSLLELYWPE